MNILLWKIFFQKLTYLDRSYYSSVKSSAIHSENSALGPSLAIDDEVNSDTTSKNGAFMSGGGAGVSKFHRGWLEVGFTEPIEIMGFEITSTAWENPSNNPNGLLKARIHEKRYQVYQGCLTSPFYFSTEI